MIALPSRKSGMSIYPPNKSGGTTSGIGVSVGGVVSGGNGDISLIGKSANAPFGKSGRATNSLGAKSAANMAASVPVAPA